MKKNYIYLSICLLFLVSSCSVLNKSTNAAPFAAQANIDPIEGMVQVDDSKKIMGSSKATYLLGFLRISGDNSYADGVYRSYNPLDKVAPVSAAAAFKPVAFTYTLTASLSSSVRLRLSVSPTRLYFVLLKIITLRFTMLSRRRSLNHWDWHLMCFPFQPL